jgi:hypothetical protein
MNCAEGTFYSKKLATQCPTSWLQAGGLAALTALSTACSPPDTHAWLPLHAGHSSVYRVSLSRSDADTSTTNWTITALGPAHFQGQMVHLRRHSEGVTFYLLADAQGLRRVAHRTDVDEEPVPDTEHHWVLKAPYSVGTEWTTPTVPHLLQRLNEHPRDLKHTHKALMTWRIEAVDDEVVTPAGIHKPCLRVVGRAQLNLYTDPVNGFNNVPLIGREWYCKGAGLVKFEREETVPPGFLSGGKLVAELQQ